MVTVVADPYAADYNTRVVIAATTMLGFAAGVVGAFTLLRRRALMGDALSHATLPGIGLAFLLAPWVGFSGKSLPVLLFGAAVSGTLGMFAVLVIRNTTKIKEDAALGIVLSVFFGSGVALLSVVQQTTAGHAAGLESFIYGKTASIIESDAWLIGVTGAIAVGILSLLFKELKLLCFDQTYAATRGFPTLLLDLALMGSVVLVTIVGLQAVGLVLMIALLVIPAAAAQFWTIQMRPMVWLSGMIGSISCLTGAGLSGVFSKLPSGAIIVLNVALVFLVSLLFGTARGVIVRNVRRHGLTQRIDRQHILRGIYELLEEQQALGTSTAVSETDLLRKRSWSARKLHRGLSRCERDGFLVRLFRDRTVLLTESGLREAARLTHEHRLWELYLIHHAEIAPARVDRDADTIEHVLDASMIDELESLLNRSRVQDGVAASPHQVGTSPAPSISSSQFDGEGAR